MDFEKYSQAQKLEKYSFLWSEARLLIAALALFMGGVPPVLVLLPAPSLYGLVSSLLNLAWIISGLASAYLLYRWYSGKNLLFGGKEGLDTATFLVSIVSGINLGLAGLFRRNIGMSISSNRLIFVIVGLIYIASSLYLFKRWNGYGKKIF